MSVVRLDLMGFVLACLLAAPFVADYWLVSTRWNGRLARPLSRRTADNGILDALARSAASLGLCALISNADVHDLYLLALVWTEDLCCPQ